MKYIPINSARCEILVPSYFLLVVALASINKFDKMPTEKKGLFANCHTPGANSLLNNDNIFPE